jgi:hypothetical protein
MNHPAAKKNVRKPDLPYPWIDIKDLNQCQLYYQSEGMRSGRQLTNCFEKENISRRKLILLLKAADGY